MCNLWLNHPFFWSGSWWSTVTVPSHEYDPMNLFLFLHERIGMTHVTDVAEYELADGQRPVIRPFFFLWRWLAVCYSVPSYVFACICFWSKLTIKANDDLLERSVLSERASTYESASLTVRRAANTISSAGVLTIAQAAILTTREQSPDEIPVLVVIMTWYLRHNFSSSTVWSIYDKTMSMIMILDQVRLL